MRKAPAVVAAVMLPVLLSVCAGASADFACGLESARERNISELDCFDAHGNWSRSNPGLETCLAETRVDYAAGLEACHIADGPEEAGKPVNLHNVAVGGAGILSLIFLLIAP